MSPHRARRAPILQRRCAPKRYFAFEPLSLESVLGIQPHADRALHVCAIVVPEVEVSLVTEHDARPVVLRPATVALSEGDAAAKSRIRVRVLFLLYSAEQTHFVEPVAYPASAPATARQCSRCSAAPVRCRGLAPRHAA